MTRREYDSPTMVEFGRVTELTLGSGASDKWDMGSGYKEGCNGSGEGGEEEEEQCT